MNKKIAKALVLCMLFSLLTGCFPTGELKTSSEPATNSTYNTAPEDSEKSSTATSAIPDDLEYVKFDIELTNEYPTELPVIKAKKATFDFEEVKSIFLDGKSVTVGENGIYYTDDGVTFFVRDNQISYMVDHVFDNDSEKRLAYMIQSTAAGDATDRYMRYQNINSELEGFPRSEALERANELLEKVDVKYTSEPIVYTFTSDDVDLNTVGYISGSKDGSDTLEVHLPKEDEFYLVKYLTTYNDIPVPEGSYAVFDEGHVWSNVDIILTKDELVSFKCYGVYDKIEVIDTTLIKCNAETALSRLYDYYVIKEAEGDMEQHLEYDKLSLAYITYNQNYETGEVTYKPMWCVSGTRFMETSEKKTHTDKFIDPTTGFVFNEGY